MRKAQQNKEIRDYLKDIWISLFPIHAMVIHPHLVLANDI